AGCGPRRGATSRRGHRRRGRALRSAGAATERALSQLLATGRPYVHLKWAMSLDGKIASASGESKWISNEASRRKAHELRGRMDASVIGTGTALADDPLLTARPPGPRGACRVVLDSRGRLPLTSQLVKTAHETPTLVVTAQAASVKQLEQAGCEVLSLAAGD